MTSYNEPHSEGSGDNPEFCSSDLAGASGRKPLDSSASIDPSQGALSPLQESLGLAKLGLNKQTIDEQLAYFFGIQIAPERMDELIREIGPQQSFGELQDYVQTADLDQRAYAAILGLNKILSYQKYASKIVNREEFRSEMELFVRSIAASTDRPENSPDPYSLNFASAQAKDVFHHQMLFGYFEASNFDREISRDNKFLLGKLIGLSLELVSLEKIHVLPPEHTVEADALRAYLPGAQPIWALDFHVRGIEMHGRPIAGGFADGNIYNIDHHAEDPKMFCEVTSAELVLRQIQTHGMPSPDTRFAINHFDADSVVSSLMAIGFLPRMNYWSDIVRAADHTGEMIPEAALLQALNPRRSEHQNKDPLLYSIANFGWLLMGQPLLSDAQSRIDAYMERRNEAELIVRDKKRCHILGDGHVAFIPLEHDIEGAFFLEPIRKYHPSVGVIVVHAKSRTDDTPILKLRLVGAPENTHGYNLYDIDQTHLPRDFGLRWNAGSDARSDKSKRVGVREAKRAAIAIGLCLSGIFNGTHLPQKRGRLSE